MSCTVAAIVSFLGQMPPAGTVITVPASQVQQMTVAQKAKAVMCAKRHGIAWRIDQDR